MEAAIRIAEAGGGYVQGHDTADTLIIKPHYPVVPWQWAGLTPDITLPEGLPPTLPDHRHASGGP